MKTVIIALILIMSSSTVFADTVYGKIYRWDTLEPAKAVVSIKNGVEQRMVAVDGSYSFEVEPGNYTVIARSGNLVAVENVTVKGKILLDLILFPEIEILEPPEMPEMEEISEEDYSLLVIILSLTGILIIYTLKRRFGVEKREEIEVLPEDLRKVLEVIKTEGGRITQKELRRKLGYSEAKISLIIADLERRGLVEKVKKGRGNIIFLKTP
ncbi:MAG: MarR family transcriptional regulator [Archaeoglobales archaeon]|nr:MarR family transcriptional regulator [Archaeoglobales archaeon]